MKVGDLVEATTHVNEKHLGLILEINDSPSDTIDAMFPYFVFFANDFPNDWYGSKTLEAVNESR